MKINQKISVIRPSRGSLVYVLRTETGLAIVDTGSEPKAASILINYVRDRLKENPEEIKYVFLTHWHGDHTGAAEKIRELTGAQIICYQDEASLLDGSGDIEVCWNKPMPRTGLNSFMQLVCAAGYRLMKANNNPLQVDMIVKEGATPFDAEWTVVHSPGHTPGSCGLWSPRQRILFSGDSILGLGKRIFPPLPFLVQDPEKLNESWNKLCQLGRIDWILPGHFSPVNWNKELAIVPMERKYGSISGR